MEKCCIYLALFMAATLLNGCKHVGMVEEVGGADLIDYCGYSNCIRLENENTRVILGPHCGGRVLEYSWKGENCIYLNPAHNGWIYEPGKPDIDPCGGRFDIGPEAVIPRHPDLWLGRWEGEIIGPGAARLTSGKDPATGVQLVREFRLDKSSSHLTCKQIIRNVSDETITWCHWSRTLAKGGGICVIPLTPNSRFPNKYIMYGPGPVMNYRPEDANIRVRKGFLEITGTPKFAKLGMDSYAGWLCYLMVENDLVFVKRFPTFPDRVYNEMAAITLSIWYYQNMMCELEPIGPMENIAPGRSASFTEEWWLLPYKFPQGRELDLDVVARKVDQEAR